MKKIIIFFTFINIIFAGEHLSFSLGQSLHTLSFPDDSNLDLKSTYSFGLEFAVDLGQNFQVGMGLEAITLSSIDGIDLKTSDRFFPAYFRVDAKGKENETFVPYIFGSYGKLVTDLTYNNGTKTITANDGTVLILGLGAKIQGNLKIEIYDATFTNKFSIIDGLTKSTKNATDRVLGLKLAYSVR